MESKVWRSLSRMTWPGSSWAGMVPSQVMSQDSPHSLGSQATRMRWSGSSTSTWSGPQVVSMRSTVSARDERTTRWVSRSARRRKESWTPRLGYWPIPNTQNSSSVEPWALK